MFPFEDLLGGTIGRHIRTAPHFLELDPNALAGLTAEEIRKPFGADP